MKVSLDIVQVLLSKVTRVADGLPCHSNGSPKALQFYRQFGFDYDIEFLDSTGLDIVKSYQGLIEKGYLVIQKYKISNEIRYRLCITNVGMSYLQNTKANTICVSV